MFNIYITLRVDYNGIVLLLGHFFPASALMCSQGLIARGIIVITYIARDFLTIIVYH
jgi:hypothetical protein